MLSFSSSLFPTNILSFLSLLRWSSQTHGFHLFIFSSDILLIPSFDFSLRAPLSPNPYSCFINPHTGLTHTFLKTFWTPTSYITIAMPVCPRSVSCHPMGSMSFKALQAQPLPHCRSHERSLSRETASSSSKTARRRTTGTTPVGRVINMQLSLFEYPENVFSIHKTTAILSEM